MSLIVKHACSALLGGLLALSGPVAAQPADHPMPESHPRPGQPGEHRQPPAQGQHHGQGQHHQGGSYRGAERAELIVCLGRGGVEATGRACYRPRHASLKIAAGRAGAAQRGELTMSLRSDQIEPFRRFLVADADGTTAADVQVCIINGANICFEGPMEFVWICITTGMLAGTDCPPPPEPNMVGAIVSLAGPVRP